MIDAKKMKSIYLGISIISIIGLSFTTSHVYASCATTDVPCNDLISNSPQDNTNHTQLQTLHPVDNYQNSPFLPEGTNPPAIITQVELASPFALFPDNQTCYDKPGFASSFTCSTDIVPGHKVQCGYFIGSSTCEPIHQYTSGTNQNCLGSQGFSNAPQWFDVYNTLNKTIQLQYFFVRVPTPNGSYSEDGPFYTIPNIGPHEKCTYGFYPIDEPISLDPTNKTMLISYDYEGKHYTTSTPLLTDVYNDNRTWQFDGNKWTFVEQNTVVIPEFPFAVPVMLIGIVSAIAFYGMKFKK